MPNCVRCFKPIHWDSADEAWADDNSNLVCVVGLDEDGADDLGHTDVRSLFDVLSEYMDTVRAERLANNECPCITCESER